MRNNHRNIEFDVHRVDGKRYQWTIHPMMRQGICVVGTVEGDEEKATATARAEIDARLGERERESVHNPTRGQLMPWSTLMPYALVALIGIAVLIASYRIGV